MVTVLSWTEQVKGRGLSEQSNDIRVAIKSCNMKYMIGIVRINLNHNISTAFEGSVINNRGRALNGFT